MLLLMIYFDSLEKENFGIWKRKILTFGKGKFWHLEKEIFKQKWKEVTHPITTIVKSSKFHPFLKYAP
jgi:hypothetical protein